LDKITKLIFNNLSKQHIQILSDFTHQHCGFLLQFFLSRFGTFGTNYQFNLHIIVSLEYIKKAVSHFSEQVAKALVHPCK